MRAFARRLRDDAVVGECMTASPETIASDDTIGHAAVLMIRGGYRHLPRPAGTATPTGGTCILGRRPDCTLADQQPSRRSLIDKTSD